MKRQLDIQRDTLQDITIEEILPQNDYLREQCKATIDLMKEKSISTHKLKWGRNRSFRIERGY